MARTKDAAKKTRGLKAAERIAAGANVTETAKDLGVSAKTTYRDLQSPNVRSVLEGLYGKHRDRLETLFAQSLDVIERGLQAKRYNCLVDEETGAITWVETEFPDHRVQQGAVMRLQAIITNGMRFAPDATRDTEREVEWEQLEVFLQRRRVRIRQAPKT